MLAGWLAGSVASWKAPGKTSRIWRRCSLITKPSMIITSHDECHYAIDVTIPYLAETIPLRPISMPAKWIIPEKPIHAFTPLVV